MLLAEAVDSIIVVPALRERDDKTLAICVNHPCVFEGFTSLFERRSGRKACLFGTFLVLSSGCCALRGIECNGWCRR